jgi:hypothetical protein
MSHDAPPLRWPAKTAIAPHVATAVARCAPASALLPKAANHPAIAPHVANAISRPSPAGQAFQAKPDGKNSRAPHTGTAIARATSPSPRGAVQRAQSRAGTAIQPISKFLKGKFSKGLEIGIGSFSKKSNKVYGSIFAGHKRGFFSNYPQYYSTKSNFLDEQEFDYEEKVATIYRVQGGEPPNASKPPQRGRRGAPDRRRRHAFHQRRRCAKGLCFSREAGRRRRDRGLQSKVLVRSEAQRGGRRPGGAVSSEEVFK